jgi:DNA-binding IclR family transcriptional regulator
MKMNRLGIIMGKIHKQITTLLEASDKPLSLVEIAGQIGKPEKTVFKALRKLFSDGKIDCDNKNRLYYLTK